MKKFIMAALALLTAGAVVAQANVYDVKLNDGTAVQIQMCNDNIFRVRVSVSGQFPQTLMERYGILKTDWGQAEADISQENDLWTLTGGQYVININKKSGKISVADKQGKAILESVSFCASGSKLCCDLASVINDKWGKLNVVSNGGIIGDDDGTISEKDKAESGDPAKSSVVSISLKDGERFYGGGSTSREHIQHRGEILRMWATYQMTEIPMPFVMSSEGWGIYNNSTRKNYFDIGATDGNVLNIYNTCTDADFYLMFGGGMSDVLNSYTLLTGRSYLLPKWAYGLCFGPNMREDQWAILSDAFNFRQVDVPCDVLWLEPQWMEKRYDFSTEKKWNYDKFSPEPYWIQDKYPKTMHNRLFIGKLRSMGYHLGLWLCEEYDLSLVEEDALAQAQGKPQSGQEHWMDHLKTFVDMGVEGFKLDPARTIDEHTFWKYYNGSTDKEMHNLNQVLLPKQMATMYRGHTGKRSWHHYCAGWSGTQHWSASTSGDNGGGKTALYDQLNLGMSGYMNTSCDVMSVPREQEMEGLHFGSFLPWVQINSWFSMMQPFYYNAEEQALYRNCIKMRYTLMPYIYSTAIEGVLTGMPIVRSMPLCFPRDRNVDDMTYQYMFGPDYCVGIFTDEIYLPEGEWTDAWTSEKIQSKGETFKHSYPSDRAGLLFVREGAIIPCMEDAQYIGTEPLKSLIIKVYPHGESTRTMYDCDAESYGYEKGLIASTRLDCSQSGKNVRFTINPVEGSFENMPSSRTYTLEFALSSKPSKVTLNGAKVKDWTFTSQDGKLTVKVPETKLSEKVVVEVK